MVKQGRNFSIAQLIQDKVAARPWANGAVACFRLSPQDYHRYHSPVRGVVKWWKELDGEYYSVRTPYRHAAPQLRPWTRG